MSKRDYTLIHTKTFYFAAERRFLNGHFFGWTAMHISTAISEIPLPRTVPYRALFEFRYFSLERRPKRVLNVGFNRLSSSLACSLTTIGCHHHSLVLLRQSAVIELAGSLSPYIFFPFSTQRTAKNLRKKYGKVKANNSNGKVKSNHSISKVKSDRR